MISGLSHPDVTGGHSTENCFLTAARGPTRSGFRNSISLDQYAAELLGPVTRFSTFNLGVNIDKANRSLSWTRDGDYCLLKIVLQYSFEKCSFRKGKMLFNRNCAVCMNVEASWTR
ncbi:MAG: DUF1552 domain-containing protein [Planctomycetaceae bacterium]